MSKIAYAINPQATQNQGCLVLDLAEVTKEGHNYNLTFPPGGHFVSKWRSLTTQVADQEAFHFLLKEELLFQQKKTGKTPHLDSLSLKQMHISPSQVEQAFQKLNTTQQLFCQGKQLVIDLFGKTEFYYEGTSLKTGQLEIQGALRWNETTLSLQECTVVGAGKPHHWFVRGVILKFIKTAINWKELQELIIAPRLLEGGKKQTFLEELDPEDCDSPTLVMKEGSLEEASEGTSPFPILKLTDRWGACADLWMDYGQGGLIASHDPRSIIKDKKGALLFKRQFEAENQWEKDLLETDYIKKIVGTSHYYCPLNCVAKSLSFLLDIGWRVEDLLNRQLIKQTGVHILLEENRKMITVKGHLSYGAHETDVSTVLGAFNRREHFVQLSSDRIGLLSLEGVEQTLHDIAQEGEWIGGEMQIKKSRFGALAPLWEHAKSSPSLETLKDKWEHFTSIQEALPSSEFKGTLRPYQQQGVNWMAFLQEYGFHGILGDEMGLGKTVQVIAFLSRQPFNKESQRAHLIVMPTSLLFNWRNEIQQFLPGRSCYTHHGSGRTKSLEQLQKEDIILTSYATLRLDLTLFQSLQYECLILDEAQMIKNGKTQTAQAVCQLDANLRLSLTGTPVENHLLELWSHFHFLIPDLFGSQEQFEADLLAAQSDRRYLERIKKKSAPFLLRRKKEEVATDLPPKLEQVVWIEMAEEQRAVYEKFLAQCKSGLLKKVESEGVGKHRMEILEAILRLRQICCHPLLVSSLLEEEVSVSSKFDMLLQDLETIVDEGHKVLVYSQFTTMLHLMTKAAKEKGWSFGYLDGGTKNREEVVTQFQEDPTQSLFFISLKAGGVGLNLTAADYVYLYDPWWNEAVEEQAINRAHRIGRKDSVIAKRLVVAESIEEKMMLLKGAKRLIIEDLLEIETTPEKLTIDDLRFLLS